MREKRIRVAEMIDELTLILITFIIISICAGSLYFIEWFDRRDSEGWNG